MSAVKKWASRQWVLMAIFVACLAVGPVQNALSYVYETRAYRDMTLSTPFYQVIPDQQTVSQDEREITLHGTFIKRRCTFVSLSAYLYDAKGVGHLVTVDTDAESKARPRGNRQPSDKPQEWGPWTIESYTMEKPITYEIWVRHTCPEDSAPQENLFISGVWK